MKNNGNGHERRLEKIEELLRMTAVQCAETAKQQALLAREFREDLRKSRAEHDREMKQIRKLFKDMIKRIAV